ncbi:MAG: hypothetical protein DWQ01_11470 [Planctomycetota bacterium]|nr:MAG: hypothetical protein DWQ01_11470 [Planctomycetota bacterium]
MILAMEWLAEAAEPWFDPNTFGAWFGAIGGGVGGSLIGIFGAMAGVLAPKGKGRTLVLGGMAAFAILGVAILGIGLTALFSGQPYGIWYPMVLAGAIIAIVCLAVRPGIAKVYRQAEQRRIDAESLRRG